MKITIVYNIEQAYKDFLVNCDNAPASDPMRLAFFLIMREQAAMQGADKDLDPRSHKETLSLIDYEINRLIRRVQR